MDIKKLSEAFQYDPKTGKLIRIAGRYKGCAAGWKHCVTGHLYVRFCGSQLLAHRVAWAIFYNEQPPALIDHINGCGSDNRIENLRAIGFSGNMENRRAAQKNNKTGLLGVSVRPNGFVAGIQVNGKKRHLGLFHDENLAHQAYLEEKRRVHKGCTI